MAETQPKPGNLYTPGTSGGKKKRVHERDKMKKAKIKNNNNKKKTGEEPGQCSVTEARGVEGPQRTWGGRPLKKILLIWILSSKEKSF